ncbi:MAG: hypothetical protein QCI82_06465 [Candidatus Thermoplasmatota archaeon]|nr:hypothetical protein [Candidatus Thermoplasmatota archaeon]
MKGRHSIPMAAALIFLIGNCIIPASNAASAFIVRIEIAQDIIYFDVSPDGNGSASVSIRIYLPYPNNPLMERVDVVIEAARPSFLNIYLSTNEISLSRESPEATVLGNMTVAPSTSSLLRGDLVISGTARMYPSGATVPVEGDSSSINIQPYYGADLYFPTPFGKMSEGETLTFPMRINNTGNANDAYKLSVIDEEVLKETGIHVKLDQDIIEVPEGGSVLVDVIVSASGARRGNYFIRVEANSNGKGTSDPEESIAALTITVEKRAISFLQDTVFSNLYFIWGTLAVLVALLGFISYGSIRLYRHIKWKRDFERIVSASIHERD